MKIFLTDNNKLAIDFEEKVELFNSLFAKQFTLIETGRTLPTELLRKIDKSLNNIFF